MTMKLGIMSVCAAALITGCATEGSAQAGDINNKGVQVVARGATLGNDAQTAANQAGTIVTNRGFTNVSTGSVVSGTRARVDGAASANRAYGAGTANRAYNGVSGAAGSAANGAIGTTGSYAANVAYQDATISQQELERLRRLERENAALRERNTRLATSTGGGAGSNAADLPPNAKKGECYSRVLIPAQYQTTTERVLDREASDRVEVIPAEYTFEEQRVLTREGSERIEVIPATYRTVNETVEVEPARSELKTVPARYENVTEKILVREAYTTWKKGTGPITRVDSSTGEIMCLVEVPAEYNTVVRKELREPARTEEVFIPAKTRTVTRRVIDQPATTRTVPIPAQYDTVRVRKLVRPAQERRIPIEATYKTVTKQAKVTDERLEWREILCETNTTPNVIRRVQAALQREGYRPGGVDGVLGEQTIRALRAYQVDNNLPSGQLTIATVRRLGVQS